MSEKHTPPPLTGPTTPDAPENVSLVPMHAPIMREKNEPRDGFEPVPLWLVTAFGILVFWGGWYLSQYSGDWRGDVLDENPAVLRGGGGPVTPVKLDPMVLGERMFSGKGNCVSCHQANGLGMPGQYPPLAGSEWVTGTPARLKRILLHGLTGPVEVKGAVYDGITMPAQGAIMNDEQIAAVLTYIRNNWGNKAPPITPEEVAQTREQTKDRATPWTAQELLAIPEELPPLPAQAPPATLPAPASAPAP